MNRRQFLSTMGLTGAGLFLPSLAKRALGQSVRTPATRLLIFQTQHGTYYPGWKFPFSGFDSSKPWERDLSSLSANQFSEALRPLHPHRNKLLVLDGLAMVSAEANIKGFRHETGQMHCLSGADVAFAGGAVVAGAPTIDQLVADKIARADRWRSLEIGVGTPPTAINYRAKAQPLLPQLDPVRLYERLFGFQDSSGRGDQHPVQRAKLLDSVSGLYSKLAGRLSAADKQKLETHRDMIGDLTKRVRGLANVSCTGPQRPTARGYGEDMDAFTRMIAAAFACDLTRIVTVTAGDLPLEMVVPGAVGEIHDEYAHSVLSNPRSGQVMTQYTAVHARQFAAMLTALDSIPEGNGTVLDNTLCVWVDELADGAHGFERWPAVIAGGQAFRTGRYIHWPSTTPFVGWQWTGSVPTMGVPHQKLLTSIGQGMGLSINAMPVKTIRGTNGARIDCTGPLDRLV